VSVITDSSGPHRVKEGISQDLALHVHLCEDFVKLCEDYSIIEIYPEFYYIIK